MHTKHRNSAGTDQKQRIDELDKLYCIRYWSFFSSAFQRYTTHKGHKSAAWEEEVQ